MGTARMAAANSILPEYPTDILAGMEHVTALADRFAPYAKHLREAINKTDDLGDLDSADLYTEVSRTIDKRLWFLDAHLQAAVVTNAENGNGNGNGNKNGNAISATTKTQQTVLAG